MCPATYGAGGSIVLWILALPVLGAAGIAVLFLLRGEGENATAATVVAGAIFAAVAARRRFAAPRPTDGQPQRPPT